MTLHTTETGLVLSDEPSPTTGETAPVPAGDHPGRGWETGGLRRFGALDGIRAFAVIAVLCYHAGISWVGGGLLGVDVFFVLSGFLITSLLCRELSRSGTVRLGRFWAQRARRLLPALIVLLLGVAVYAYVFRSSIDSSLVRGDALSTLLYVANWHFIFADQGYFAQTAAPSPLLHTWSLAVEEQYYLVWPLIALFVVRRFGVRALAATAAAAALASALLMGILLAAGTSIDRLYYGTDTRAQALLVGSFLGAMGAHRGSSFSVVPERWRSTPWRRRGWTVLGLVGAAYLVWAWHALDGQDLFLYRGGFLVVALAAGAVVVGCVTAPASLLSRALSVPVLVFVGRISYGLYLYHWPLFLVIDHAHTGLSGGWLLLVRLVVTLAVATVSFVCIEEPIRTRQLFRGRPGLGVAGGTVAATAAVVVAATVVPAAGAVAGAVGPSGLAKGLAAAASPIGHRQELPATSGLVHRPITFLLTGDSEALTLGIGLSVDDVRDYGVHLKNGGLPGCDLDDTEVRLSGVVASPAPSCVNWPAKFRNAVDGLRPDVVGVLLGRWEVDDHLWRGQWVHVGETAWDRHLVGELERVADILSSTGAKVIFFTSLYVDPPVEAANGSPYPENSPSRVDAWNRDVAEAAAGSHGEVTLVDLNRLLDPSGHYQSVVDGYTVRSTDGIHLTMDGGRLVQPSVLPLVVQLGLEARASGADR